MRGVHGGSCPGKITIFKQGRGPLDDCKKAIKKTRKVGKMLVHTS